MSAVDNPDQRNRRIRQLLAAADVLFQLDQEHRQLQTSSEFPFAITMRNLHEVAAELAQQGKSQAEQTQALNQVRAAERKRAASRRRYDDAKNR